MLSNMGRVHKDKRYNRKSYAAVNVANDIIAKVKNKEPINLVDIQVRNGYSRTSALAQKALQTKSFKQAMNNTIELMEAVRAKSLLALVNKDHSKEKYRDLADGIDKMTKNTQLLSGKATENTGHNVIVYGSEDFLALQQGNVQPSQVIEAVKQDKLETK